VQDRTVKLVLGGEMPEDDGFGNAGRLGDLFRRGSLKAALREKVYCPLQYLFPAQIRRHSAGLLAIENLFDQKYLALN
jgi:hypothetical protein